jgi:hypothetical protein
MVMDEDGNRLDLDGALHDGERLYLHLQVPDRED